MTTIERLRETVQSREGMADGWPIMGHLGDARALLAHHDALTAIYTHAKYRPEDIDVAYHEWVATWKELNSAEQEAFHALTTPEPTI